MQISRSSPDSNAYLHLPALHLPSKPKTFASGPPKEVDGTGLLPPDAGSYLLQQPVVNCRSFSGFALSTIRPLVPANYTYKSTQSGIRLCQQLPWWACAEANCKTEAKSGANLHWGLWVHLKQALAAQAHALLPQAPPGQHSSQL